MRGVEEKEGGSGIGREERRESEVGRRGKEGGDEREEEEGGR